MTIRATAPFLMGNASVAARWVYAAHKKLEELGRRRHLPDRIEWKPQNTITVRYHRIGKFWRIIIDASGGLPAGFLVHICTLTDVDSSQFAFPRQIIGTTGGSVWSAAVPPAPGILAGTVDFWGANGERLSWNYARSTYFSWIGGDSTLGDGTDLLTAADTWQTALRNPIDATSGGINWIYGANKEHVYYEGELIIENTNDDVVGASVIPEEDETWVITVQADQNFTNNSISDFEVRVSRLSDAPITTTFGGKYEFLDNLSVNSKNGTNATHYTEGPYMNYSPWRFRKDGRKATALIYDDSAKTWKRWELDITGSGGGPIQSGGTMAASFTDKGSAIIEAHTKTQTTTTTRSDAATLTGYRFPAADDALNVGFWCHPGFDRSATVEIDTVDEYAQEIVIAADFDEDDNLVELIWRRELTATANTLTERPFRVVSLENRAVLTDDPLSRLIDINCVPSVLAGETRDFAFADQGYDRTDTYTEVERHIFKVRKNGGAATTVYDKKFSWEGSTTYSATMTQEDSVEQINVSQTKTEAGASPASGQTQLYKPLPVGGDLRGGYVVIWEKKEPAYTEGGSTTSGSNGTNNRTYTGDREHRVIVEGHATRSDIELRIDDEDVADFSTTVDDPGNFISARVSTSFANNPAGTEVDGPTVTNEELLFPHTELPNAGRPPHIGFAFSKENYIFLTSERLATGNNQAKIFGPTADLDVEPEPLTDKIAEPDISSESSLRFSPILRWE